MLIPSIFGKFQHGRTYSRVSSVEQVNDSATIIHSSTPTIYPRRKEGMQENSKSWTNLLPEHNDQFGKLPPEIRVIIYDLLLVHDGIISVDIPTKKTLAILQVCRLYHHEASHIFYGKNHFLFTRVWDPTLYPSPVAPIAETYLPLLKRVTVSINTGHPCSPITKNGASLVQSLSHTDIKLDQLTVTLGTELNPMIAHFFDDSLMGANHPIFSALSTIIRLGNVRRLRVRLNVVRFGKSVAHSLYDSFTASGPTNGRSLEFYTKESYSRKAVVVDLSNCERREEGVYTTDNINPERNLDWGDAITYSFPLLNSNLGSAHRTLPMPAIRNQADDENNIHIEQEDNDDEIKTETETDWESEQGQSTLVNIASWCPDLLQ